MNRIYSLLISLFLLFSSISYSQDFPLVGEVYNYDIGDVLHKKEVHAYGYQAGGYDVFDTVHRNILVIDKYYTSNMDSVCHQLFVERLITYSMEPENNSYSEYTFTSCKTNLNSILSGDGVFNDPDLYNGRLTVYAEDYDNSGPAYTSFYENWTVGLGRTLHVDYSVQEVPYEWTEIDKKYLAYYKKGDEEWGEEQTIVGLEEVKQEDQIIIYPNPASDYIQIQTEENTRIQIFNSLGQIILIQNVKSTNSTIDVSSFLAGFYVVHSLNEDGAEIGKSKFIKK